MKSKSLAGVVDDDSSEEVARLTDYTLKNSYVAEGSKKDDMPRSNADHEAVVNPVGVHSDEPVHVDHAIGYQKKIDGDYFKLVFKTAKSRGVESQKDIVSAIQSVANVMYQFHLDWRKYVATTGQSPKAVTKEVEKEARFFKIVESNVPKVVDHWVDRIKTLHELCDKIKSHENVAISGIAGSGKTQLAREFSSNMKKLFEENERKLIIWEFSLDESSLEECYEKFIKHFKLRKNKRDSKKKLIDEIQDGLDEYFPDYTIVFIYDNVDSKSNVLQLREILKAANWLKKRKSVVLVTTQASDFFQSNNDKEVNLNRGLSIQESLIAFDKKECSKLVEEISGIDISHITRERAVDGLGILIERLEECRLTSKDVNRQGIAYEALSAVKLIAMLDGLPLSIVAAKIYLQKTGRMQRGYKAFEDYIEELKSENQTDLKAFNDAELQYMSQYYIKHNTGYDIVVMSTFTKKTLVKLVRGKGPNAYIVSKNTLYLVNKFENTVITIKNDIRTIEKLKEELRNIGNFEEGFVHELSGDQLNVVDKIFGTKSADSHHQSQLSALRMLVKLISNDNIEDTSITPLHILKLFSFFSPRNIPALFIEKMDRRNANVRSTIIIDVFIRTLNDHSLVQDTDYKDWHDGRENRTVSLHSVTQRAVRSLLSEGEKTKIENECMEIIKECNNDPNLNRDFNLHLKKLVGEHCFHLIGGALERCGKRLPSSLGQNLVELTSYLSVNYDARWPILIIDNLQTCNIRSPVFIMEAYLNAVDCMFETRRVNDAERTHFIVNAVTYYKKIIEQLKKSISTDADLIARRISNRIGRIYLHNRQLNDVVQSINYRHHPSNAGTYFLNLFSGSTDLDLELYGTSKELEEVERIFLVSDLFVIQNKLSDSLKHLLSIERNINNTDDLFLISKYEFRRGIINLFLNNYEKALVTFNGILNLSKDLFKILDYFEDIILAKAISLIYMKNYSESYDLLRATEFSDRCVAQSLYIQCVAIIMMHIHSSSKEEKIAKLNVFARVFELLNKRPFKPKEILIFEAYMMIDESPKEALGKITEFFGTGQETATVVNVYASETARRYFYFLPRAIKMLQGEHLVLLVSPYKIKYMALMLLKEYYQAADTFIQYQNEDIELENFSDDSISELIAIFKNISVEVRSYEQVSSLFSKRKTRYKVETIQYCLGIIGQDCNDVEKNADIIVSNLENAASRLEETRRAECYLICGELLVRHRHEQCTKAFGFIKSAKSSLSGANKAQESDFRNRYHNLLRDCSILLKNMDLNLYLECLREREVYEENSDLLLSQIGICYDKQNNYASALECHLRAYELATDARKRTSSQDTYRQNIIKTCQQAVSSVVNQDQKTEIFFRETLLIYDRENINNILNLINFYICKIQELNEHRVNDLLKILSALLKDRNVISGCEKQILVTLQNLVIYFRKKSDSENALNYCKEGLLIDKNHPELSLFYCDINCNSRDLSVAQIHDIISKLGEIEQMFHQFFQVNKKVISLIYLRLYRRCVLLSEVENIGLQKECVEKAYGTDESNVQAQRELEDFNRAHKNLRKVVELCKINYEKSNGRFFSNTETTKKYNDALIDYGVSLLDSDVNLARTQFLIAKQIMPSSYLSYSKIARIEFKLNNFWGALNELRAITPSDPDWEYQFLLAFALSQLHEPGSEKIYESLSTSKSVKKNSPQAYFVAFMSALHSLRRVKYECWDEINFQNCRKLKMPVVIEALKELQNVIKDFHQYNQICFGCDLTDIFSDKWISFYYLYARYVAICLHVIEIRNENDLAIDYSICVKDINEIQASLRVLNEEIDKEQEDEIFRSFAIPKLCGIRLKSFSRDLMAQFDIIVQFTSKRDQKLPSFIEWSDLYQKICLAVKDYTNAKTLTAVTQSVESEKFLDLFNKINIVSTRDEFHIKQTKQLMLLLTWYAKLAEQSTSLYLILLKHFGQEFINDVMNSPYDEFELSIERAIKTYLKSQGWGIMKGIENLFSDDISYRFIEDYFTLKFIQSEHDSNEKIHRSCEQFLREAKNTSDLRIAIEEALKRNASTMISSL